MKTHQQWPLMLSGISSLVNLISTYPGHKWEKQLSLPFLLKENQEDSLKKDNNNHS